MPPRPAPKGQPREALVGQPPPTAAQLTAADQPNQTPTLSPGTFPNNPAAFSTSSVPVLPQPKPAVQPISNIIVPAGGVPNEIPPSPGAVEPRLGVPPPDFKLQSPTLPPPPGPN